MDRPNWPYNYLVDQIAIYKLRVTVPGRLNKPDKKTQEAMY